MHLSTVYPLWFICVSNVKWDIISIKWEEVEKVFSHNFIF